MLTLPLALTIRDSGFRWVRTSQLDKVVRCTRVQYTCRGTTVTHKSAFSLRVRSGSIPPTKKIIGSRIFYSLSVGCLNLLVRPLPTHAVSLSLGFALGKKDVSCLVSVAYNVQFCQAVLLVASLYFLSAVQTFRNLDFLC